MRICININETVKVRLTERGIQILEKVRREAVKDNPILKYEEVFPLNIDSQGYADFQLWELMEVFGEHCHIGCEPPFETTIVFEK